MSVGVAVGSLNGFPLYISIKTDFSWPCRTSIYARGGSLLRDRGHRVPRCRGVPPFCRVGRGALELTQRTRGSGSGAFTYCSHGTGATRVLGCHGGHVIRSAVADGDEGEPPGRRGAPKEGGGWQSATCACPSSPGRRFHDRQAGSAQARPGLIVGRSFIRRRRNGGC